MLLALAWRKAPSALRARAPGSHALRPPGVQHLDIRRSDTHLTGRPTTAAIGALQCARCVRARRPGGILVEVWLVYERSFLGMYSQLSAISNTGVKQHIPQNRPLSSKQQIRLSNPKTWTPLQILGALVEVNTPALYDIVESSTAIPKWDETHDRRFLRPHARPARPYSPQMLRTQQ